MAYKLFGFTVRSKDEEDKLSLQNFATPEEFDGAYTVEGAGVYPPNPIAAV